MRHPSPRPPPRHRGWTVRRQSHRRRSLTREVGLEARLGARTPLPADYADYLEIQFGDDPDDGYWMDTDPLPLLRIRAGLLDGQRFAHCLAAVLPPGTLPVAPPEPAAVPAPAAPETFPDIVARIEADWKSLDAGDSRCPEVLAALAPLAAHPYIAALTARDLTLELVQCLVPMVLLRNFWIRPVATWIPPAAGTIPWWRDLLAHLLVRFPLPAWLDPRSTPIWGPRTSQADYLLLIAAGQGWSLTGAGRVCFREQLEEADYPPGILHHLAEVPAGAEPASAPFWMLIRHLGGDETLGNFQYLSVGLLNSLVPWLVRHRSDLRDQAERQNIIDWAYHQHIEAGRKARESGQSSGFSMKGRSLRKVREAAAAYRALLDARNAALALQEHGVVTQTPLRPWKGRGWDWEADHAGTRWAVRELCSPAELLEETQAQRHCVVTYAGDCAAGHCAIFSVTENGYRRVTVEVLLPSRQVVQVRGFANRLPTLAEDSFVRRWQAHTLPP